MKYLSNTLFFLLPVTLLLMSLASPNLITGLSFFVLSLATLTISYVIKQTMTEEMAIEMEAES